MSDTVDPALAPQVASAAEAFGVPGLAVALAAPGRQALLLHGEIVPGSGRPVTADSWFSCASMGKHVTAAAVLELARDGRLDLQAPVGRYLADLPPAWAQRSVGSLLRHTAGLPEYLAHAAGQPVPATRAAFVRAYGSLAPVFPEGQAWMYSNTHYILAGFLVAQLGDRSYADAVHALFERAGVEGARVGGPQWARRANEEGAGHAPPDVESACREVIGDGDVAFTPKGALAWLEALLEGRVPGLAGDCEMLRPATFASGRPSGYGCGWFLERTQGRVFAHHAGHFDGWTALALLDLEGGCGAIAMCNAAPGHSRWIRHLGQLALEGFAPGSTPLAVPAREDDRPELGRRIRAQLLRRPGELPDPGFLAEELRALTEPGAAARPLINLWAGVEPTTFEFVEAYAHATGTLRRYRIRYGDRTEHVQVGLTPDERLYWVWGL